MLGQEKRGLNGIVPVGRDVPIGLNIERFLGPANPFGQDPFKKSAAETEPDEERRIASLVGPSESMGRVLQARLGHLKVLGALWSGPSAGPSKAIQHAIDMDDDAVLVDLLNGAQPKLASHVNIDLAMDLSPSVTRLIESEYEDYVLAGLNAAGSVLKAVGHVMRETAEAAHENGYWHSSQRSIHFEERVERCDALAEVLSAWRPRLEELSVGRGRSAQLASRVAKSLGRAIGEVSPR